ncbi:hypothetical protein [Pseudoalteromonas sp. BDTF-M6]|uniref:hypothetical protein n=1 Tax=Pseudoalteromonas sp. BDTF-M6 TaxID=2796132 RepID=UPI001BAFCF89|nr:hypothetical protein [Pseudoalteromonas sp. BDTF-M6]MBS3796680.1 hypothetical protein [Pseudoalteromonas sp. BDTF-M6]
MALPGFIRNFIAAGAIAANRLVSVSAANDFEVNQANGATAVFAGVTEQGTDNNNRVDVVMTQIAPVEFGGDLVAGMWVVADADGKAVEFDPANFVGASEVHVAGWVMEDGDAGTIGDIFLNPHLVANIPAA